jgi:hypothetical protein
MNYFVSHLFRDWKWWAKIGFVFVLALNALDLLSAGFASPGYFNLWVVRLTVAAGLVGLVIYYLFSSRRDKKKHRVEELLPVLEAERRAFLEKNRAADPGFRTLCYECCHYDAERRCCRLRLHDRVSWIKLSPLESFSYCIYWNLSDHPILALTDRVFQDGKNPPGGQTPGRTPA